MDNVVLKERVLKIFIVIFALIIFVSLLFLFSDKVKEEIQQYSIHLS